MVFDRKASNQSKNSKKVVGADPELDFEGGALFPCEKFLNTIVCYGKYCHLRGHGPWDLPLKGLV